ncbi:P-loop containing nucleoside triphosphate hydrolase protein [Chaetomium sp. MPI-CAGE-AT-0009]|nr:P-loop containing nucleoside triphosphate hydrolase protein [Chaetomium sp. MPI-CAGE-AT-0009]
MTDLLRVLPHFPVGQFARLISVLEKHAISTSDLLTLEAADIGKRTHLPLLDVKRLCGAVLDALHADLGVANPGPETRVRQQVAESGAEAGPEPDDRGRPAPELDAQHPPTSEFKNTAASLSAQWQTISTLDPDLDRALGGGIPAGYVTEVTGESGAGKTQFLLALLLSVQLPPPHGLGRPALYISTEAPLSTRRLAQMLSANPLFQRLPPSQRPSLDNIISTVTPDLESQDHILTFQVPVEVERRGIGLVVLDSVAANYRAEFERSASSSGARHGSNMGARTTELVKLGMHLRDLAQRHNLAVVVSNQRWFTGWGDDPRAQHALKTPALGLVWTTQVAARIALSRRAVSRGEVE